MNSDEPTRCVDVLSDTLSGYQGIGSLGFNVDQGEIELTFDPRLLRQESARSLAERVGREAASLAAHCERRSETECALCAADMRRQIDQHFATLGSSSQTSFNDMRMRVALNPSLPPSPEPMSLTRSFGAAAAPGKAPRPPQVRRGLLEVWLTAVNLTALLLALGAGRWASASWLAIGLYVVAYLAGGAFGVIDGLRALRNRRLDVNLLMILAALGAALVGQPAEGAALLFLFSLSNTLQSFAMDRSRRAIEKLMDLRPRQALTHRGSRLVHIPIEQLVLGDRVQVRPGERIPIDGEVIDGQSDVDQAPITGESIPVAKAVGNPVYAGTMNGRGSLEIRVTHLAGDTTLAKIIKLVEDAQSNRATTQRMIDGFEQVYAILVLTGAALLTVMPLLLLHQPFYPTFYRAMTWLVVASPCALVISTPASILSAIANGARHGVLFKGGAHLEKMASIKVIAFDKTGTLTVGKPKVAYIEPGAGVTEEELLEEAASIEARSEHPLAVAVVKEAKRRGLHLRTSTDFLAFPGLGVEASLDGRPLWIGGERLFYERRIAVPEDLSRRTAELESAGHTVMLVYRQGEWRGLLAVADTLRPGAAAFVRQLKSLGIDRVVMLTGDNERVAATIAAQSGVDEFHAGLLPEDKVTILKVLRSRFGAIAMVGDGVNDAPALATADLGVAMGGAGTDVALETADVVLMSDDLGQLPYAIGLSRSARKIVRQNLAFSLSVIVLLVVAAFGVHLPLPVGVAGHEGSTVLVVLNGLRLLGFRGPPHI